MRETRDIYRYALTLIDQAPDGCMVTIATRNVAEQPVTLAMGTTITDQHGHPIPGRAMRSRYRRELAAVQACRVAHTELASVLTGIGGE